MARQKAENSETKKKKTLLLKSDSVMVEAARHLESTAGMVRITLEPGNSDTKVVLQYKSKALFDEYLQMLSEAGFHAWPETVN